MKNYQQGYTLIVLGTFIFVFLTGAVALTTFVTSNIRAVNRLNERRIAGFLAQAGIEKAIWCLNHTVNADCGGTAGSSYPGETSVALGDGTFTTTVTDSGNNKIVVSTGALNSGQQIVLQQEIEPAPSDNASFFYGAQVGDGGLTLKTNSTITGAAGTVGTVYSDGSIKGNGASSIITGDAFVANSNSQDTIAIQPNCFGSPGGDVNVGEENPQIDVAQSFIPSISASLSRVDIYLKKVGDPENRDFRIVADNGGIPATSDLGKGEVEESDVSTSYSWVNIDLDNPVSLTASTTYWLVFDAKKDDEKYWVWCSDAVGGYADGEAKYSKDWKKSSEPWTDITGDLTFKLNFGTGSGLIEKVSIGQDAHAEEIKDSTITGDAYYQTISGSTVGGTSYPGSANPPYISLPVSDGNIIDWKTDAAAGGVINGDCGDGGVAGCNISGGGTLTLGPKQINGNLNLDNNQTLKVSGTLYVTGYINLDNNSILECDSSYGSDSCIVIVDGWIHVKDNAVFRGSGTSGSYMVIITTLAGCYSGGSGSGCTDHGGAVDLHENTIADIIYAPFSLLHTHNNVNMKSVVAYAVELDNNATITYEIGLMNTNFTSGTGGRWFLKESSWQTIP